MPTSIAQASPSDSGASEASDFQPPTANPQIVPGELFPESPSLQNPTADDLLRTNSSQIITPNNPAPASLEVAEARSANWLTFLLLLVVLGGVLLTTWRRRRITPTRPDSNLLPGLESEQVEPEAIATPPVKAAQKASPKKHPKRSKSKRKKRARK